SPLSLLLYPLSLVFRLAVAARRLMYRVGALPSARAGIPVIVVGNLTVGGTGKTPLILALAKALRERGLRPGIISRGYRGAGPAPRAGGARDAAAPGRRDPLPPPPAPPPP